MATFKVGDLVVIKDETWPRTEREVRKVVPGVTPGEIQYFVSGKNIQYPETSLLLVSESKECSFPPISTENHPVYYPRTMDEIMGGVTSINYHLMPSDPGRRGTSTTPTPALRYNDGKPQLSYIYDFPKAFGTVLSGVFPSCGTLDCLSLYSPNTPDSDTSIGNVALELFQRLHVELGGEIEYEDSHPNTLVELLTGYNLAVDEFCRVCSNGALKYKRDNWKRGFPISSLLDSFTRHYRNYLNGDARDNADDKLIERFDNDIEFRAAFANREAFIQQFQTHHLAHCIWNLMVIIEVGTE